MGKTRDNVSMTIYLGTQGWSYKDWVGPFYPPGSRASDFLQLYSEVFDAVELDTTFYGVPRTGLVEAWNAATPDHFQFTAKLPRSITHDRHLVGAEDDLYDFVRAMEPLGQKLGPLLIQLPPDFTVDEEDALRRFLAILPSGFRFAAEFRHRSWVKDETLDLLREHGVGWTSIDLVYMPRRAEVTSDFAYVRWLGDRRKIQRMDEVQIDRTADLDAWAVALDDVSKQVQRVYGFANNHYSGHSPADIRYLHQRLGKDDPGLPGRSTQQGTLL
jgi:uncharacterized protein YecE (DUF72 family)